MLVMDGQTAGERLLGTARCLATGNRGSLVLLRSGLNVLGAGLAPVAIASGWSIVGFDAVSYWLVDPVDLYRWTESTIVAGPFRYSPVLGQLADPLGVLSRAAFQAVYLVLALGALVGPRWTLGPGPAPDPERPRGRCTSATSTSSSPSRWASAWCSRPAWAFLLLSKATPGVVLVWFVVRGEWRKLACSSSGPPRSSQLPSVLTTPSALARTGHSVSTQYASSAYGGIDDPRGSPPGRRRPADCRGRATRVGLDDRRRRDPGDARVGLEDD